MNRNKTRIIIINNNKEQKMCVNYRNALIDINKLKTYQCSKNDENINFPVAISQEALINNKHIYVDWLT